ncbi:selenium binding protein [Proteus vulgaris]|uniref:selenium binding protein n=1 Tax=Proteus vulgaris TaxID=585 RepID=UPI00065858F5|nr:selenium binding protein [Proteus vulgaris]CRL61159.1 hypothetical protein BN1805_01093 [Proteus vulgaris]
MYEEYTTQALPSKKYRELLGTCFCVFNSNNNFVIENILRLDKDKDKKYSWHILIDKETGQLLDDVKQTINQISGLEIADRFYEVMEMRNRLVRSYQVSAEECDVSDDEDNQILATKYSNGKQEYITEDFLFYFIDKNKELSERLYELRDL